MSRHLVRLLPGALVLGGVSLVLAVPQLWEQARPVIPVSIYAVMGAGIALGLRFGNVRATVALLVLGLASEVVTRFAPPGEPAATSPVGAAVALLVPLDLAALAWAGDQGPRWPRVKIWAIVIGLEVISVALLLRPGAAGPAGAIGRALSDPLPTSWPAVASPVLVAFVIAFVLMIARFLRHPRPMEAGLLWALVAAFRAFGLAAAPAVTLLYLGAAGLVLIVALIETSHALAYTDELTALPTRRALNDLLGAIGPRYTVAMVDIDHFKKFNDTYGHQAGDQLLRRVAAALGSVTGGGRAFRYGGEEFAVVFPGLVAELAAPHLEKLRKTIAEVSFAVRAADRPLRKPKKPRAGADGTQQVGVTVSIGVADSTRAGAIPADVVTAADQALYRAKRAGRNRLAMG